MKLTRTHVDEVQESNEGNNNASGPVGECLTIRQTAGLSARTALSALGAFELVGAKE
ncbi:MAG: hypothetical protein L0206_09390 [Actinobacteria bacterium]|nr:hypothetical protein [Actinomycetota bacterium]